MSHLDHVLDDALAGFDEDEEFSFASSTRPNDAAAAAIPSSAAPSSILAAGPAPSGTSPPQPQAAISTNGSSRTAISSNQSIPAALVASSSRQPLSSSSSTKQFDPLKRRGKGKSAAFPAAAGLGGSGLGSSNSSSTAARASSSSNRSGSRPALTPEVHKLQDDLAQLMSEWSTAMHPHAAEASQPAAVQQQRGVSSVLAALAEQTQRTVEEQSRLRPPPVGAAAAGGATDGAGGGGEQMNVIVDVVMQHLLSKEVLYTPMKEILDKYPPWLDKHLAPGSPLSPDDLERYRHQYMCIRRLCEAYETEPNNTAKIMELLQEMQACGEPPADIVEEMSAAIAGDLPADAAAGAGSGDMNLDNLDLEGLGDLPAELKNCPVQ